MPRLRVQRGPGRNLGDLPYYGDRPGPVNDPGLGLIPAWINNYTTANYPFIVGLAAQQIIPANPLRAYLLIQNKNGASDMFINFGQKATAFNGVILIPRGNYELIGGSNGGSFVPSDSVWILGGAANMEGVLVEGVLPPTTGRRIGA